MRLTWPVPLLLLLCAAASVRGVRCAEATRVRLDRPAAATFQCLSPSQLSQPIVCMFPSKTCRVSGAGGQGPVR